MEYILKKEDFDKFFDAVIKDRDFIAPTRPEGSKNTRFAKINSTDKIVIETKTYFPAKELFFKTDETIFRFDGNKIINPEINIKNRIIFGLRRCDLTGIKHQDMVFLDENIDPFYKARRDASILIGLHCKKGDDYCFCNSLKHEPFFDVMFYDKKDIYAIETGSDKGKEFIEQFDMIEQSENVISEEDRVTINNKTLDKTDISAHYENSAWKELANKCVQCGACNFLCPNCHCFSFEDEINFDLKTGKRIRKPASCQLRNFTRVAGNHIFRSDKTARFKHRIYHQLQYFKERHGEQFCTGCGRCIQGCPARIDWVKTINCL